MRKRIVIGLMGIVVCGGIAAMMVWSPSRNRVEFHIKQYKAAQLRMSDPLGLMDRVRYAMKELLGQPRGRLEERKAMMEHERALVRLGYLEERKWIVSNRPAPDVLYILCRAWETKRLKQEFVRMDAP